MNSLNFILETFNSFHSRLKFTMEISKCDHISFLDVNLIVENRKIIFDLFKKPTNSGRYLNFYSNHSIENKKGVIINLFDRTLLLSHPRFQSKNLTEFINVLANNAYPLNLIFFTINNRIKNLSFTNINERFKEKLDDDGEIKQFFTIPYIKSVSEKSRKMAKKHRLNLTFASYNSLSKYIKTEKDQLDPLFRCSLFRCSL